MLLTSPHIDAHMLPYNPKSTTIIQNPAHRPMIRLLRLNKLEKITDPHEARQIIEQVLPCEESIQQNIEAGNPIDPRPGQIYCFINWARKAIPDYEQTWGPKIHSRNDEGISMIFRNNMEKTLQRRRFTVNRVVLVQYVLPKTTQDEG